MSTLELSIIQRNGIWLQSFKLTCGENFLNAYFINFTDTSRTLVESLINWKAEKIENKHDSKQMLAIYQPNEDMYVWI